MSLSLLQHGVHGVSNNLYSPYPVNSEFLFKEPLGTATLDNSSYRRNGIFGSTTPTRNNLGIVLNGSSQWSELPVGILSNSFTVCVVFNSSTTSGSKVLSANTNSPGSFNLYVYGTTIAFGLANQEVTFSPVSYTGNWACLVGVLNPGTDMRIFANGVKRATISTTDTNFTSGNGSTLFVGKDSSGNYLPATVSYVATLPASLSDTQVSTLTNTLQNRLKWRGVTFSSI